MNKKVIDLRSDTVTLPKPEMMEFIAQARLGDDLLGEDPTVRELERKAANLLGMEEGLLVLSGTMANQVALMTYCDRGQEILLGKDSHLFNLEGAAMAAVAQVQPRPIEVHQGYYDPELMEEQIHTGDIQKAETSLICLENTYNLNKGQVVSVENMKEIKQLAEQYHLPVYMDGARIFNALIELDMRPADLGQYVDGGQFCLTKGLGCPLGSVLVGNKEFITKARLNRQRLGGGMRQAGVIAAPGIYALDHMIDRLSVDHQRAKRLAKGIAEIEGLVINLQEVHTNIISPVINVEHLNTDGLLADLAKKGVKVKKIGKREFRMIVHYQITDEDIDYVLYALRQCFPGSYSFS
ncbi:aminotransferase class I/II-fold pyridoxal phosphate-dependent enzyme [Mesobacillus maritimus]|uniref:threonine aldolase family protein n=1 Tax=Mesobacillus maritimus TaxID=1643336 RepID=UPI00203E9B31|nr:GntG family PLP-dependent aldolase [Mesobacillus maritimus]MCM3671142.1 aminotransferase class I/II-fold pyridoxal phosphate-dependent enzyme [Mesobacillus maritimus]